MLVDQRGHHQRATRIVSRSKAGQPSEGKQHKPHRDVQRLRPSKAFFNTQPHDQRVQFFTLVEIVILRRVNQIEARNPEHHRKSEHQGRQRNPARHSKPRPHR